MILVGCTRLARHLLPELHAVRLEGLVCERIGVDKAIEAAETGRGRYSRLGKEPRVEQRIEVLLERSRRLGLARQSGNVEIGDEGSVDRCCTTTKNGATPEAIARAGRWQVLVAVCLGKGRAGVPRLGVVLGEDTSRGRGLIGRGLVKEVTSATLENSLPQALDFLLELIILTLSRRELFLVDLDLVITGGYFTLECGNVFC